MNKKLESIGRMFTTSNTRFGELLVFFIREKRYRRDIKTVKKVLNMRLLYYPVWARLQ